MGPGPVGSIEEVHEVSAEVGTSARFSARPCVGLDVHQKTCTATWVDPGGKEREHWKFGTTRAELEAFAGRLPPAAAVGLEASTVGKAVCRFLRARGAEVHMASPRQLRAITTSAVKTDKRDSAHLAHLLQSDYFPRSYLPPIETDRIRTLVRFRMNLGRETSQIKNRVHALVARNLLQERMEKYSDWFGKAGLQTLIALPLEEDDRFELRSQLEQLKVIVDQEEDVEREMARLGKDRKDVKLLMTIPGVDFYTALGIAGEIGDIHRYPTMAHLASDAGLVPRADNSGEVESKHRHVKRGNHVMKYFLLCAINGMLHCRDETSIAKFYRRKERQIGGAKARVAAGRKLARVVWKILTTEQPFAEQQQRLTDAKTARMAKKARRPRAPVTAEELASLADDLGNRQGVLDRLVSDPAEREADG